MRDDAEAAFSAHRREANLARIDHPSFSESSALADLRKLIGHREYVAGDCPLELVHKQFGTHQHEYMAVVDGDRLLGLCSRHDIGMRLGARYGFALFSRDPIRNFVAPSPVLVSVNDPIAQVLETVFSRADESFYDDVILLDENGKFLGLIYVHSLVRLQTGILRDNIQLLVEQERVVREKNAQMEEDLAMAREIQIAMLAQENLLLPANPRGAEERMRFSRVYKPAQKVGGDFIHVLELPDQAIGIFIADVMGHGVRSALVTAMLRALVEEAGLAGADPGQLLTQINRALGAILREAGELMFATAFYLIANRSTGTVQYACAGHPSAIQFRRGSGPVEALPCARPLAGPGLCLIEEEVYQTMSTRLADDDVIVLFTDGLIEAMNARGDLFGLERLQESIARHRELAPSSLVQAIVSDAEAFAGIAFDDDVCVAALEVSSTFVHSSAATMSRPLGSY